MTNSELYRAAADEIEQRRINSRREREEREEEVYKKVPQIREIRIMLSGTAAELSRCIIRRDKDYKSNFEKIRRNNLDAQEMIRKLLKENGYPEDYLNVRYRCELCSDRGFVDGRQCKCFKRLVSRLAVEEFNKTANMPDADFNHFSLEYYRDVVVNGTDCFAAMRDIYDYCRSYAENFSRRSGNILMYGKTGLGKTHLSMAMAKEITAAGYNVMYGSVINFLRSAENEYFGRSEGDTLSALFNADLLIMDDLGAEFRTPFNDSTLYNIINTRINNGLPVIINTNLSGEELSDGYSERIISRIGGSGKRLHFVGKDIRQLRNIRRLDG